MPLCISCTHPIAHLYTVYESAYNLRLEQCSNCKAFADPYVEHDSLTLLLDLILLKRGVYRHLLYNRGTEPRQASSSSSSSSSNSNSNNNANTRTSRFVSGDTKEWLREKARWWLILRLGSASLAVDAFIRWAHINPEISSNISLWTPETSIAFVRITIGCLIEMLAFHGGIILASYFVMKLSDTIHAWVRRTVPPVTSGIRQQFRVSLIPLTIFYSSSTKLFLLLLLTIWQPSTTLMAQGSTPQAQSYRWDPSHLNSPFISAALEFWDEDKLDREWVVRNILGGMAAGFGLRVVLDCHPLFTTVVILAGWAVKTAVAMLMEGWIGGDERTREVWLAYSIP
ncbi:Arv1-like family-domain-containing protein [Hygrophoropsis aurantiaca]|uniref:Arv1-like family-domain-containing protein n=1 Tax=Hygrophoropsis aurantiaca TaxID=72124 RepID=A0ACB8AEW4_9AGAM|nr:Arv1-like family-domain-containing protein [Hygrophoropsis aurantiaca]